MVGVKKRRYESEKRALAAEQTRLRIIEAARSLLSESGYPNVSIAELAAQAQVARQTIYTQFGSKRGVLQAVSRHIEQIAFGREDIIQGAREVGDPVSTLRAGIENVLEFYRDNAPVLRTFKAQAIYDPDFRSVWNESNDTRWTAAVIVMQMVEAQGRLAADWTAEQAADWFLSELSFDKYDQLTGERGWTLAQIAWRIHQTLDSMLLDP
jgi:AcrR family transcriptional regulator